MKDLIQGHYEVEALIQHIDVRVKANRNDIAGALDGRVTDHHGFMLKVMRKSIQDRDVLIAEIDAQTDSATEVYAVELELLKSIPDLGKDSVIGVISETGTNIGRFPNEHQLSSWAGLSLGNNESAGKKKHFPDSRKYRNTHLKNYWFNAAGRQREKKQLLPAEILKHFGPQRP